MRVDTISQGLQMHICKYAAGMLSKTLPNKRTLAGHNCMLIIQYLQVYFLAPATLM